MREVVRAWLVATLPLDDERRAEARIWSEYSARAASSPAFAAVLTETDAAVRRALAEHLQLAGDAQPPDSDAVAHALVALSDGLAAQLLYDPDRAPAALDALDRALAALLGP